MRLAPYRVHKMIQDLMKDPAAAAAFARDPEPAFAAYALTDGEKTLLRRGTPAALHELGVHPNLQMKLARLRVAADPPHTGPGPLDAYLAMLADL